MKRVLSVLATLCLTLAAYAGSASRPLYTDNEIYLGLTDEAAGRIINEGGSVNRLAFIAEFSGLIVEADLGALEAPFYAAKGFPLQWVLRFSILPPTDMDELSRRLNEHPASVYAERVPMLYLDHIPNDLGGNANNDQWHLYKIQAREAWDISKGNKLVTIAIVDDAVQITHPDLVDNIWVNPGEIPNNGIDDDGNGYIDDVNGWDAGGNDNDPLPNSNSFNHGTHCAGIVGATSNNGLGVASIGYSISIVPVKCTLPGQTNTVSIPRGYEGVTYAAAAGVDIISCSWGGGGFSSTGSQAIQFAQSKGCIVVAAMGNDGDYTKHYPASYTGVISVAATANTDVKASFSNYDDGTTVSAPGTFMKSTITNGAYQSMSGTSMATPLVSGTLGLMKSHLLDISNADLRRCLLENAENIDSKNSQYEGLLGSGRINAYRSLQCVDSLKKAAAPLVNLDDNSGTYCPGSVVQFSYFSSMGEVDSVYWEFPGGTPSFSTESSPVIYYPNMGTFSYSLEAFNQNGSDAASVTNGIVISDQGTALAVNSGFETGIAGSIWTAINENTSYGWMDQSLVYGSDTVKVVKVNAYGAPVGNLESVLLSEILDFSDFGNPVLSFNYAYARRAATAKDSLFIEVSSDSGQTFTTLFAACLSAEMNISGSLTGAFTPGGYFSWCEYTGSCMEISLKKLNRAKGVQIRIRHLGQTNANNFYLDQIRVEANCAKFNTNAPVAAMANNSVHVCEPVTVLFEDQSMNYPSSFRWYFPGGTPSSSTNTEVEVSYSAIGSYDVFLAVEGALGYDSIVYLNHVNIYDLPQIDVLASDTLFCEGQTITLTGSGGVSYTWSPLISISSSSGESITASPVKSIVYFVQGTDAHGCSNTDSISLTVLDAPAAATIFRTGTKLFVAHQSGMEYEWFLDGVAIPFSDSFEITASATGVYSIVLRNPNTDCSTPGKNTYFYNPSTVNPANQDYFKLYPVPAGEWLILESEEAIGDWNIYSADGKLIVCGTEASHIVKWKSGEWVSGLYVVEWRNPKGIHRARFTVQ